LTTRTDSFPPLHQCAHHDVIANLNFLLHALFLDKKRCFCHFWCNKLFNSISSNSPAPCLISPSCRMTRQRCCASGPSCCFSSYKARRHSLVNPLSNITTTPPLPGALSSWIPRHNRSSRKCILRRSLAIQTPSHT
jgi:hypothetical protein